VFLQSLTPGETTKIVKDTCMFFLTLFGMMIAIYTSASAVPGEVENRIIHTVISKPLTRFSYLLGKFIGIQLIVLLNVVLMALLFAGIVYFQERSLYSLPLLFKAVSLAFIAMMMVSALTFTVSVVSTSAVLPIICGFFIYIIGSLTNYLKILKEETTNVVLARLIGVLYQVMPNLQEFNIKDQLVHFQPGNPTVNIFWGWLILYGLSYILAGYILAYLLFTRKEV